MAVKATSANGGLIRNTGSFLSGNANFTYMYWVFFLGTLPPASFYRTAHLLYNGVGTDYISEYNDPETNIIKIFGKDGGVDYSSSPYLLILTNAYHIATVYDNTAKTVKFYINGSLVETISSIDYSGSTFGIETLLSEDYADAAVGNIAVQNYRSFQAALTINEIQLELGSNTAVKASPFCDTPLTNASDLADVSGNGRDWTVLNSGVSDYTTYDVKFLNAIATEGNSSATAAYVIPYLPYKLVQNIKPTETTFSTAWFSINAQAAHNVIGFWAYSGQLAYNPSTRVYLGPAASPVLFPIPRSGTKLGQFPVDGGTQYFLKVDRLGGGGSISNPGTLILQIDAIGNAAYEAGDIFIPGDNDPSGVQFPGAIIRQSENELYNNVLTFIKDVHISEQGDVLESGVGAVVSNAETLPDYNKVGVYSNTFTEIADVTLANSDLIRLLRTGGDQNTFYVATTPEGVTGTTYVNTIDSSGEVGGTSWTIPDTSLGLDLTKGGLCANVDGTILYYTNYLDGYSIQRWNLTDNSALSEFLPAVAGYFVTGILVLSDNSVVIAYQELVDDFDFYVVRYNSAGVLLNTYNFGDTFFEEAHRLSYSSNPDNFRVWIHGRVQNPVICHFYEVVADTEAIAVDIPCVEFANTFSYGFSTPTPPGRFGPSFSCPFWELREGGSPPVNNPLSGIYKLVPGSRKTNDTLWTDLETLETEDVKIPDPFVKFGPIGK